MFCQAFMTVRVHQGAVQHIHRQVLTSSACPELQEENLHERFSRCFRLKIVRNTRFSWRGSVPEVVVALQRFCSGSCGNGAPTWAPFLWDFVLHFLYFKVFKNSKYPSFFSDGGVVILHVITTNILILSTASPKYWIPEVQPTGRVDEMLVQKVLFTLFLQM